MLLLQLFEPAMLLACGCGYSTPLLNYCPLFLLGLLGLAGLVVLAAIVSPWSSFAAYLLSSAVWVVRFISLSGMLYRC